MIICHTLSILTTELACYESWLQSKYRSKKIRKKRSFSKDFLLNHFHCFHTAEQSFRLISDKNNAANACFSWDNLPQISSPP